MRRQQIALAMAWPLAQTEEWVRAKPAGEHMQSQVASVRVCHCSRTWARHRSPRLVRTSDRVGAMARAALYASIAW